MVHKRRLAHPERHMLVSAAYAHPKGAPGKSGAGSRAMPRESAVCGMQRGGAARKHGALHL